MIGAKHWIDVEQLIASFEQARREKSDVSLSHFVPNSDHPHYLELLTELVRVDMELAWNSGRPKHVEEYLAQFAELNTEELRRVLFFEEDRLRRLDGDSMSIAAAAYLNRSRSTARGQATENGKSVVPTPADRYFVELDAENPSMTRDFAETLTSFPQVGEHVLGFELVGELGRGAFSRVYLAREHEVADRLVALKITGDVRTEVAALARLRHTNIAPVLSVRREPPLEAICMPYLGATTLRSVIRRIAEATTIPATGRFFEECLREPEAKSPLLSKLASLSFVDAVLELATRLAAGLAHAHDCGLCHRDLKPANVLLADDGEPLLLDFNLSEARGPSHLASGAMIGGTLPYMAPEQLENFAGAGHRIDKAADVYSLGLVLFELLTGRPPVPIPEGDAAQVVNSLIKARQASAPRVDALNRDVSPAFASIIARCLALRPADRYGTGGELHEDLLRQSESRPLRFAPELSLRERIGKWTRRHPRLCSAGSVAALSIIALVGIGLLALKIERGRVQLAGQVAQSTWRTKSREARLALWSPTATPEALTRGLTSANEAWAALPAAGEVPIADKLRLAMLAALAEGAVHRHSSELQEGRGPDLAGSNWGQRVLALRASESPTVDDELSALELARKGQHAKACRIMEAVTERQPDSGVSWHARGVVESLAGRIVDAESSFTTSVALIPDAPDAYHCRAVARRELKRHAQALSDLSKVLELCPQSLAARFDLALTHFDLGDLLAADRAVTEVIEAGYPETRTYFFRARVRTKLGNASDAMADRRAALSRTPRTENDWTARVAALLPAESTAALADCDRCAERFAESPRPWVAKAHILAEYRKDLPAARSAMDQAIQRAPEDATLYASRGVLAARARDIDAARSDAAQALTRGDRPEIVYQVAGIFALTATERPADREQSLFLLQRAVHHGYGTDLIDGDPELKSIVPLPEVRRLLDNARRLRAGAPGA